MRLGGCDESLKEKCNAGKDEDECMVWQAGWSTKRKMGGRKEGRK